MKTETTQAGHRVIIKRALRSLGYNASDFTPENLDIWAKNNPQQLTAVLTTWFGAAAKAWERGNNSGDNETLHRCEAEMVRKREQAESVLSLFDIECDYPGLYPSFMYKGFAHHSLLSVLKAAEKD
jgi:hypothetical protein